MPLERIFQREKFWQRNIPGIKGQISIDDYQKEQQIDGKTVDTDTGEIIEEAKENDGVVDFRQAKQA